MQRRLSTEGARSIEADLQRLREDVARTTALVENLLQLARLDPELADALVSDTIDVQGLLDDVVRVCAPQAATKNIAISVHCRVATMTGNRDALLTALRNLVHNGISYGRMDGKVDIAAESAKDVIRLTVRDDGDGVAEVDRQRLTQRFFRVLGSGVQGSGLGLSIVARVVELHHGDLQFGSGLDGRGLGVVLALPTKPPHLGLQTSAY